MEDDKSIQGNIDNRLRHYQVLMDHRQRVEGIFWSRIQTLHAIQAGVLAGSYALRNDCWYSQAILLLGFLLTFFLYVLCHNDRQDAEVNQECMFQLGDSLGIRWSSEPRGIREFLRSHRILFLVVAIFLCVDLALSVYFWVT